MPVSRPSYLSYPDSLNTDEKIRHLYVGQSYGFKSLVRAVINHCLDLLLDEGETASPVTEVYQRLVFTYTYKGKTERAVFRWCVDKNGEGKVYEDLNN